MVTDNGHAMAVQAGTAAPSDRAQRSDRLRDLGVSEELCQHFLRHGIETITQLRKLGVEQRDFQGLCKFVQEDEPELQGDTRRVQAYLLQQRIFSPGI